ncbi:unnamed protein product [Rotaria sp. Silwood1]|nr:unnamed protein product [Rotaria sp. Silwood1]CAF5007925.1 unnamed protein product [Rotaria sp. Silwood1]
MFEENIDEKRVVTDTNMLLENVICPICYYILWKPIACGSCKNLLCRKCSDKNSNLCPFCRVTFQEQSPESNILSLLYNLRIRCYNSSNGCTDIVSYDLLEQHENLESIWICFPFIRRHLILFVYSELSKNVICFVLTSINDTYFTLYLMLTSFISILINLQLSIHDFHLNNNFEKSLLCILLDFILPKLCLLMLRLFFEILPSFICTICWSLMVIFTIGSLF